MPSKNMIRKGKRRQSVKAEYRRHRDALRDQAQSAGTPPPPSEPDSPITPAAEPPSVSPVPELHGPGTLTVKPGAQGIRLDLYLSKALAGTSRARVQTLIEASQVLINDKVVPASTSLHGGERIDVLSEPTPPPLHGEPENIPLDIVYEDDDLAVIDKPSGMMVHAGSGSPEHNRGTLVNALLFHFEQQLSAEAGERRPGIVHRLDKETSGLIMVAKNDRAHRALSTQFSSRTLRKTYIALVHGYPAADSGTIDLPISRDHVRRTRMTTRHATGRHAVTHWQVIEKFGTPYGLFSLLEVRIETGRTHQIRVHMQAIGRPVVGDTTYGAPEHLRLTAHKSPSPVEPLRLGRNFLHAAELEFTHPITGEPLRLSAPLPPELEQFVAQLRALAT